MKWYEAGRRGQGSMEKDMAMTLESCVKVRVPSALGLTQVVPCLVSKVER